MKTAMLIMAAGIGSRFGGGIKQLAKVDDGGHIIMDYSIHDAIAAGFNKIIFVIRKDIEADFREVIGSRVEQICARKGVEVCYAFQSLEDVPAAVPEGRLKPWGTGQAVLAARDYLKEPFVILNADDYYGKEAFRAIHDFLVTHPAGSGFCMAGFRLRNTLSEHGSVTRGICKMNADGFLTDICETRNVVKTADGVAAGESALDPNSPVSMNIWGFTLDFVDMLSDGFAAFFREKVALDPLKAEFLIPVFVGQLLRENKISVKVLETKDTWFGVTYAEDREKVTENFRALIKSGAYTPALYDDL